MFLATKRTRLVSKHRWAVDSGATDFMSKITPKTSIDLVQAIATASGSMQSSKIGDIPIVIDGKHKTTFKAVLFCPDIAENLASVSKLLDGGYKKVSFFAKSWRAYHTTDSNLDLTGPRQGNLYILESDKTERRSYAAVVKKDFYYFVNSDLPVEIHNGRWTCTDSDGQSYVGNLAASDLLLALHRSKKVQMDRALDWHTRLGHLNLHALKSLVKTGQIQGLNAESFDLSIKEIQCAHCLAGKMKEANIPKNSTPENRATKCSVPISLVLLNKLR